MTQAAEAGPEEEPRGSDWEPFVKAALITAIVLFGVVLAAYAVNGYYTRFWADDFCHAYRVQRNGLFGAQIDWYNDWTGRYMMVFLTDLVSWLGAWTVPYWAAALIGGWLAVLTWTLTQVSRLLFGKSRLLLSLLLAEAILFAYTTAAMNRVQSLYWVNGTSAYVVALVWFTLFAGLVARAWLKQGTERASTWRCLRR